MYYDLSLQENNFVYFNKAFVSKIGDEAIRVLSLKSDELDPIIINKIYSEFTYLVIFINGFDSLSNYSFLANTHLKEIMVITQENYI